MPVFAEYILKLGGVLGIIGGGVMLFSGGFMGAWILIGSLLILGIGSVIQYQRHAIEGLAAIKRAIEQKKINNP